MKDKGYVIQDKQTKNYYCGLNAWDKQLRKAKIYHSIKYATDYMNRCRNEVELKEIIIAEINNNYYENSTKLKHKILVNCNYQPNENLSDYYIELDELFDILDRYLIDKSDNNCINKKDAVKYLSAPNNNGDRIIYADDLDLLPPVTPKPNWNMINTLLPTMDEVQKNSNRFIVTDGNRTYQAYFDYIDTHKFGQPNINGFEVDNCAIAWTNLPEWEK